VLHVRTFSPATIPSECERASTLLFNHKLLKERATGGRILPSEHQPRGGRGQR
jgi:hypothetical protein